MTQLNWYGTDPLMSPADRLPLVARQTPNQPGPSSRQSCLLGIRFAQPPMKIDSELPQCGRHAKSYTIDRKTENTKVIIDGKEENHSDTTETEREID